MISWGAYWAYIMSHLWKLESRKRYCILQSVWWSIQNAKDIWAPQLFFCNLWNEEYWLLMVYGLNVLCLTCIDFCITSCWKYSYILYSCYVMQSWSMYMILHLFSLKEVHYDTVYFTVRKRKCNQTT